MDDFLDDDLDGATPVVSRRGTPGTQLPATQAATQVAAGSPASAAAVPPRQHDLLAVLGALAVASPSAVCDACLQVSCCATWSSSYN